VNWYVHFAGMMWIPKALDCQTM